MAVHPKQGILQWDCLSKYSKWTNMFLIKSCKEQFALTKVGALFIKLP